MTEIHGVFDRLVHLLESRQVDLDVLANDPVFTSEQAAQVRGTSLSSGAKALVCKVDQEFLMFVRPTDRRLAGKDVPKQLGGRSLRFANLDEVHTWTGLKPGCIPPFGSFFGLPTCCDERLADETTINFKAGDHARLISMSFADYLRVEKPRLGVYAR